MFADIVWFVKECTTLHQLWTCQIGNQQRGHEENLTVAA